MSSDASKIRAADQVIRSGIAGGVAGCVAKTVVAPLDRVKILFQASNPEYQKYAGTWSGAFRAGAQIYSDSGVLGLFQGHSATLLRIFPYAAVKFIAYDQVHDLLMPTRAQETNLRRFSAGAISGAISVLFTYPLDLLRVRMAFNTIHSSASGQPVRPSFLRTARLIYAEGLPTPSAAPATRDLVHTFPILKFYRGFSVSLVGIVPYAGTAFLTWGYLRATLVPVQSRSSGRPKATPLADLGIGALSGALAQTVSYPFEVVRRRMQVGGLTEPGRWLRWGETVRAIWTRGGMRGFFVGLGIGYLKIVPMNAVSFAVWQGMKRLLEF
ncbi:mitochondrial carrier domain-containing protein [Multifurca ochricompacta]|uniref:Mitochondrial carrier domain-containing protein n=1 Tax=Multifurca ochricompacta TaxID=376703 RepID=A0AAD4M356_9AGAM|nr:mitochondrial carrier domain-containing protein [Multifurca ochricompacta]